MKSQRFQAVLVLTIVALAFSACGPSEAELASTSAAETAAAASPTPLPTSTFTPTITPTNTSTPTPTPTPIPFNLSVLVSGEDDMPVAGASVILSEVEGDAGAQITDDVGQSFWNDLPGETINLSISAQGYFPQEISESIGRGINQLTVNLDRDPHGLLPSEACAPGEKLLYIEDFQDGEAQGWQEIEFRSQGWDLIAHPDSAGNLVILNPGESDTQIVLQDFTFDDAVWRIDLMPHGYPDNFTFFWHFVTEPYEVKDGTVDFSAYSVSIYEGNAFRVVRMASPFPEVVLSDIIRNIKNDEWHVIEISTFYDTFEIWLDGTLLVKYNDPDPLPGGPLALALMPSEPDQSMVYFDNMTVCELSEPFVPMPTPES